MIFKGIDSKNIEGLIICKEPPISKPAIRTQKIEIDGRDGAIVEELGYEAYTKKVEIGLRKNADVNKIISYFSGEGDLTFECEKDKVYKASIYEQIDLEKLLSLKKGNVIFYCQPFKYKINDEFVKIETSVVNEGNKESKPIIRLEKCKGNFIDMSINDIRFNYTFGENDTYVEIDCEEMEAVYQGFNRNRNLGIGFDFPVIYPNTNTVTIHSGDATIKMKRKDKWL